MGNPDHASTALAAQEYYEEMSAIRRRLVGPLVVITLAAFFLQQVLTNFTSLMDGFLTKGISVAYAYSTLLFIYAVVATTIYRRAMDRAEAKFRPAHIEDEVAGQYEHWRDWEQHEEAREEEDEVREELYEQELAANKRAHEQSESTKETDR